MQDGLLEPGAGVLSIDYLVSNIESFILQRVLFNVFFYLVFLLFICIGLYSINLHSINSLSVKVFFSVLENRKSACDEEYLYLQHGLAVLRAGDRSYVTILIRGWSRLRLTYITSGCRLEERKLTSQSPSITVEFSVQHDLKITSVIIIIMYLYILGPEVLW